MTYAEKLVTKPRQKRRKLFIPPPTLLVTFEARMEGRVLKLGKCVNVEGRP